MNFPFAGNWTNESLKQLKADVMHMFYFQYQNYDHTPIDLYYIRENKPAGEKTPYMLH